jgi:hypothetical protein
MNLFQNRKLIIATKHEKETVMSPLLEKALGVSCFVNDNFDTDILGTFTGEIDRKLDPVSTARQKCLMAMELSNCDLGVASEGSFGAHPTLFFASADDEFLIFIDKKNDLEIIAREISTSTNFNGKEIKNEEELLAFAQLVQFPSHGIILRKAEGENQNIIKGITDIEDLQVAFEKLQENYKSVYAETDMRALYNPTRMKVIEITTQKLIDKIKSECPKCSKPGFGITAATKGLKCSLCGSPTKSTLSYVYECQHCQYTKEEMYPNAKTTEDPMYCDYCNP